MLLRKGNSFVWYMLHSKQHARYFPARRCSRTDEHFGTTMFFRVLNGPSTDRVRILTTFTRSTFCKITQVILNKNKKISLSHKTKNIKSSQIVTKSAKDKNAFPVFVVFIVDAEASCFECAGWKSSAELMTQFSDTSTTRKWVSCSAFHSSCCSGTTRKLVDMGECLLIIEWDIRPVEPRSIVDFT